MGCSSEIVFLLIFIATSALTNGNRDEGASRDNEDYVVDGCTDYLTEKQYVKISSNNTLNITETIKEDLNISANNLVSKTANLLFDLANTSDVENLKNDLIEKLNDLTQNVINEHKEHLNQYNRSITDELIAIQNQTLAKFNSLDDKLPTLASKSATDDMKVELIGIRSLLDNMPNKNDTKRLENQLSSLKTEHDDIKLVCKNTDSSSLPSTEDKTQTSSEVMELLKELQEFMKAKGCEIMANATGQHFKQPSKQAFEKSDIFGIISVVALVVLFVLVIVLIKRIATIQNKLSSMQIQVAHEKYYRRESDSTPKALQLTKPQEQRTESIVANPVINMYEDSELTESLMDKN